MTSVAIHLIKCVKCGKVVERTNACQKYCRDCSPWKRKRGSNAGPVYITCKKCGKKVKRISNAQSYCLDCSPYSVFRTRYNKCGYVKKQVISREEDGIKPVIRYVCERCRRPVINDARRKNCDSCEAILARQERKRCIKHERRQKKLLSHLYKHVADQIVPMRYVPQKEIDTITRNLKKIDVEHWFYNDEGYVFHNFSCEKKGVEYFSENIERFHSLIWSWSPCPVSFHIYEPGFYRVMPTAKKHAFFVTGDDPEKTMWSYYYDCWEWDARIKKNHVMEAKEKARQEAWKKEYNRQIDVIDVMNSLHDNNAPNSTQLELMTMGFLG